MGRRRVDGSWVVKRGEVDTRCYTVKLKPAAFDMNIHEDTEMLNLVIRNREK